MEALESETGLGGYGYDQLLESLATGPMGSDIQESASGVLLLL